MLALFLISRRFEAYAMILGSLQKEPPSHPQLISERSMCGMVEVELSPHYTTQRHGLGSAPLQQGQSSSTK